MFSNILSGAAGFPVADLGDEISQSLRFRGGIGGSGQGGFLSRAITTSSTTAALTISFWVKLGNIPSGYNRMIFSSGTAGSASGNISYDMASDEAYIKFQDTSSYTAFTTPRLRDHSAWYHIVYRFDAANGYVKIYVNGTEKSNTSIATSARTSFGATSPMQIGRYAGSGYANNYWDGYLAEWNMLFGTSLGPDSFGRYQEDGVWVPKSLGALTSDQYGALGNRLVFNSSAGLGDDTAPTGGTHASVNDFTASGFNTADINSYITQLTATVGGFPVGKANAFDGDINTRAYGDGNGTWQFAPDPAIPFDSLRIYSVGGSTTTFNWNGNSTVANTSSGGWRDLSSWGSGSISTSQPLTIVGSGGGRPELNALEVTVGGVATIVTSATVNDVDYKDTPTNNHPTINALYPVSNPPQNTGFKNGNLGYTGLSTQWSNGATTIKLPSTGEYYWEHEVVNLGDHQYFGVTKMPSIAGLNVTGFISFRAYNGINWYVYQDSSLLQTGTYQIATGDIIGQAYNIDTGVYRVWVNGTLAATNTWSMRPTDEDLFIYGSLEAKSSNEFRVNYGQRDFIYTPPTGAKRLHTNNLPEPTIKNGSEHFQAILAGPDQGVGTGERGGNWSAFYKSQTGSWWDPATANNTHAFDGSNATNAQAQNQQDGAVWEGFDPITVTSSVQIGINSGYGSANVILTIDGTEHTATLSAQTPLQTAYTGSGTLTKIEFPPNNNNYGGSPWGFAVDGDILVDSGPLAAAQAAFPNGLWWIKDRDGTSAHQLVDSVRGDTALIKVSPTLSNNSAYLGPSGSSIAWCWNAPDEMDQVTRESGNINVTAGRVNQDAGFSILQFTGNATNGQTVAHGLTQAPEFMIAIAHGNTNSIPCWHGHASGAPNAATSLLNGNNGLTLTHVAAVNNQFITIQGNTAINDTGVNSMYLWHSVPGYSAFGSYNGGGSGSNPNYNGPFIYLGFKPSWLLIKRSNAGGDPWVLLDSSRDTHNFAFRALHSDSTNGEVSSGDQYAIDFLSNGFKIRSSNAAINNSSGTYVYAAFAENPFGGENAPPATAR